MKKKTTTVANLFVAQTGQAQATFLPGKEGAISEQRDSAPDNGVDSGHDAPANGKKKSGKPRRYRTKPETCRGETEGKKGKLKVAYVTPTTKKALQKLKYHLIASSDDGRVLTDDEVISQALALFVKKKQD